jgi:hypothetical protein
VAVGVSRVWFTESNDARPTCFVAAFAFALLTIDQIALRVLASQSRGLYITAVITTGFSGVLGMNCALGCIWHPIPKERRADGQLTTLHLGATPPADQDQSPTPMFQSLDENFAAGQEEVLDESQVELRDPIQWLKLLTIVTCVGIDFAFMVVFGH